VIDHQFSDSGLAGLYDVLHPWTLRDDLDFYLPMVMAAESVLDVGCGTGSLLHRARADGHTGHLVGIDPANGMLERARERRDIEWHRATLTTKPFDHEFDLIVMTGHAFQVLLTDADLHSSLEAAHDALTDTGRFSFETRNPTYEAWKTWTPEHAIEMTTPDGTNIRMQHQVTAVTDDLVTFTTTYSSDSWPSGQLSESTLRFLTPVALDRFLSTSHLHVERQYGNWDRSPLTKTSPEIITITRRA
jgi:SAM-dependent methyltransferase